MSDDNANLLRLASEYAEQEIDLYDLLGIDALTTKQDIHRAWRTASLKYHPDKAGDRFDASKWELLERARDVLSDPSARAAYDNASKAKLLRRQERQAMDQQRRRFADDLEAREQASMQQRRDREQARREAVQRERERLAEAERVRVEDQRRRNEAVQDAEDLAEAKRRLQAKKDEKARLKQVRETLKPHLTVDGGNKSGPAGGAVDVPGEYCAGPDDKCFWELVCDKLRAIQHVRDVKKRGTAEGELVEAERKLLEVRNRIHEVEIKYQREQTSAA
ncbi:DNAJ domain protein Cwf23 [Ophiocordyceps camponoti-floridani]|uniref:DNAJ domain protein Cwf23 n=1 Tax=Ophiocordyceps camponoti-floridani TaxID=2030778 RepID=A0A8H4Q4U6_9HYPO|nr:DNAJ domain protein Cwf23 [Ophiocordyceps camponoti-floridani]